MRFQRHDLLSLREVDSGFSLVVCKNVLLHFSHAQRVDVIRMFHRCLGPGGYFVTEHTQKLPAEVAPLFEQVVPHGQLFRKGGGRAVRVILLENSGQVYSCNVYLVLGDWSAVADVNTLIDVGRDPAVLDALAQAPTGVGKRAVDQVVLTHEHYDHVELVGVIRERFNPTVFAFSGVLDGVDHVLHDGDLVKAGDRVFEVLHTPGHSSDSICLYCPEEAVLFAGDTTLLVHDSDSTYEESFAAALEKICARNIRTIYFGHGAPLVADCNARLQRSLEIVNKSVKRGCGMLHTTRKVHCEVV